MQLLIFGQLTMTGYKTAGYKLKLCPLMSADKQFDYIPILYDSLFIVSEPNNVTSISLMPANSS